LKNADFNSHLFQFLQVYLTEIIKHNSVIYRTTSQNYTCLYWECYCD